MNVIACIPSLNRQDALRRCIASLDCRVLVSMEREPRAITTAWNSLIRCAYEDGADVVVFLSDHLEAWAPLSDVLRDAFVTHFPDLDGVVGLNLSNLEQIPGQTEYCFLAIGRRFLERFPDARPCCPDYYHFFFDTELGEYAKEEGKFFWCEEARVVTHLHGGDESKALQDPTHQLSRLHAARDEEMRATRKYSGMLWGRNFDLVSRGEGVS